MQVAATARNLQVTDDIREYIERKVAKLERFLQQIDEVNAMLEESRHRYSVELTLLSRRAAFHAQATTGDVFASIDEAVDKLEQQIRRYKERIKDRRHRAPHRDIATQISAADEILDPDDSDDSDDNGTSIDIARTDEHLANKPMTVEEAVMQLSLTPEAPFLAFLNAQTGDMNVVYRESKGQYNWIEPEW